MVGLMVIREGGFMILRMGVSYGVLLWRLLVGIWVEEAIRIVMDDVKCYVEDGQDNLD